MKPWVLLARLFNIFLLFLENLSLQNVSLVCFLVLHVTVIIFPNVTEGDRRERRNAVTAVRYFNVSC